MELSEEKKEQVKLKCWAGYATEEKMRDDLKFSQPLPLQSKNERSIDTIDTSVCTSHNSFRFIGFHLFSLLPWDPPMDIRTRINAIKAYCEKQGGDFVKWLGWYHFLILCNLHSLQVAYKVLAQSSHCLPQVRSLWIQASILGGVGTWSGVGKNH